MSHELTNLLPSDRAKAVKLDYFWRLGTVIVCILSFLLIAHGLLLIPTYQYISGEQARQEELLKQVTDRLKGGEGKDITVHLDQLQANATQLIRLKSGAHISLIIEEVLNVPRTGIALTSFSFAPAVPRMDEVGQIGIRGVADTRDSLQHYKDALAQVPGVTNVELPINAYAKEKDIIFDITVTGTFSSP